MALVAAFPAGAAVPSRPRRRPRRAAAAPPPPSTRTRPRRRSTCCARRQRRRRRGRRGRRARRRRAVLVRHRRRRLHGHRAAGAARSTRSTAARRRRPHSAERAVEPGQGSRASSTRRVTSGLGVGVPGTVRGWEVALDRYGTRSLRSLLRPGDRIAREGFAVDETFTGQTVDNAARFDDFTSTRRALPARQAAKPVGAVQRNPDLASTYERIGADPDRFYRGPIARDIVATVQHPPEAQGPTPQGAPGPDDPARPRGLRRDPPRADDDRLARARRLRHGPAVLAAARPSARRSTSSRRFRAPPPTARRTLHRYLEASKLAYADRGAYLGDPAFIDVPLRCLLSDGVRGDARAALIATTARCDAAAGRATRAVRARHGRRGQRSAGRRGPEHDPPDRRRPLRQRRLLHVHDRADRRQRHRRARPRLPAQQRADRLRLRPGHGELAGGGKRPRSCMAPTIVLQHGRPVLALGSPGGATIITTVLQIARQPLRPRADRCPTRSPRRGRRSATARRRRPSRLHRPVRPPALDRARARRSRSQRRTRRPRSARSTGHRLPAPRGAAAGGRGADPPRRRAAMVGARAARSHLRGPTRPGACVGSAQPHRREAHARR